MITFNEKTKTFQIDTDNTTYVFCITNQGFVEHLFYGKSTKTEDFRYLSNRQIYTFSAQLEGQGREFALSTLLSEMPTENGVDFRSGAVSILNGDKTVGNRFKYQSHKIYSGRNALANNLPYSRGNGAETLELSLIDEEKAVKLDIVYVAFPHTNVIARHIEIENRGAGDIKLLKAQSLCLDLPTCNYDLIETFGMYLYEFGGVRRSPLKKGYQGSFSNVGSTSHHANPFFMIVGKGATENYGEAFGFNLLYSGGFDNRVEVDRLGSTRIITGVNPESFEYTLAPNQKFVSPEAIFTYTDCGIGQVSRNFHEHIRDNILPPKFAYATRPIVINSWECVDMAVSHDIMVDLAKNALQIGADTVVLDDGWFRGDTQSGLGDWVVDKTKFPKGLGELAKEIRSLGLKFGIWFEPEGVVQDSKFFANNPKSVLQTRKDIPTSRSQYVIDFTNPLNIENIRDKMFAVLDEVRPEYLKWDYNSYIYEAGSSTCPYGEVNYRQAVGVYRLLSEISNRYPDMLIEGCSGGGGRFDLGMLFYSPQIWISDNTDPFARAYIQHGATFGYPTSCISCHLTKGVCTSQRESSLEFRYGVASMGVFGYEYDLTKLSEQEKEKLKEFSTHYKEISRFVLDCDLFRLIDINTDLFCAFMQVSKDKNSALFTFIQVNSKGFNENILVKLNGLSPDKNYKELSSGAVLSGSALMNAGLRLPNLFRLGSGGALLLRFEALN